VWRTVTAIAVAGSFGAVTRYGLNTAVTRRLGGEFPWGTFIVNVSGAFLVGVAFVLASERGLLTGSLRTAVTVGFLGAYTTFSTLAFETYRLADDRALGLAFGNVFGSCAAGMVAVYAGVAVGRLL